MGVRIEINKAAVAARVTSAWQQSLGVVSEQALKDCNELCKQDQGNLIASSQVHSDLPNGRLQWVTPYAARQYWKIPTASKDKNPGAQWRWAHAAKALNGDAWARLAQRIFKEKL